MVTASPHFIWTRQPSVQHFVYYKKGGIGALYELRAPSATPHSSLLTFT